MKMEFSRKQITAIIAVLMIASMTIISNLAATPVEGQLSATQPSRNSA